LSERQRAEVPKAGAGRQAGYKKKKGRMPLEIADKEGKRVVSLLCDRQPKINELIFLIF